MLQLPLNVQLDDFSRFSNFYAADNEQLCEVLSLFNQTNDNFIFIWGASQTGKTHLAHALCHHLSQFDSQADYLPLDNSSLNVDILEGMSCMDTVILDNFDAITGDRDWEVAVFDLYNNASINRI